MPHFHIETNEDGSVRRILRDGEPHGEGVSLEQLFSIVTLYFILAAANVQLIENEESSARRRAYGVQSFVMALTGLEAFTNTFFKLRGEQIGSPQMIERVGQRHGSLTRKIRELLAMTPGLQVEEQDMMLDRIHGLSQLRNTLVHPQWEPASMTLAGDVPVMISGLVHNFQAAFEDGGFCRESLMWCLLLVARIGRSVGNSDPSAFLFHWTGIYGLSEQQILDELGIA